MGVTSLWQILEPAKQHVPLSSLGGKTLAVDLSLWVCEAQMVKKMMGVVTKPHLRNLFFRVSSLTLMGIHLVFVMEGDPPKLKANTMRKRTEIRFGPSKKPTGTARKGRSRFKTLLKECLEMLECLGVPWIQAAGEAEATCAYLNANGYVDGCITNDGDAFLYGAQTVYRNFTMNIKDPHVDCYSISSIEEKLSCGRESLIGLAILLGCDYLPKGVPGVGKEQALKLIRTLRGESLLQRFEHWKENFHCGDSPAIKVRKVLHCAVCQHPGSSKDHERVGCQLCNSVGYCVPHDVEYCCPCGWHSTEQDQHASAMEDSLRKKAKACEGFPFPEVIQEYLISKDKLGKPNECRRPDLLSFQRFAFEKMDWTKHYACEKVCPLLTQYDMNRRKSGHIDPGQLQARRIVKTRTKNGIPCFEIEWQKPDHYVPADDQPIGSVLITIEESSLFQAAYPEIVILYQMEQLEISNRNKKGKETKVKKKELSAGDSKVVDLVSQLTLQSSCETVPPHDSMSDFKTVSDCHVLSKICSKSQSPLTAANFPAAMQNQTSSCISLSTTLQNRDHECDSGAALSSQVECTKQPMDSYVSSAIANLQLSDINWEESSFSTSPFPINVASYPGSELSRSSASMSLYSRLHSETTEIPFSDSVQYDEGPVNKAGCSVSDSGLPEERNCLPLKERVILKLLSLDTFPKAPAISQVNPLQIVEQIKGTTSSEGEFPSSDQLNETEKVSSEKYPKGLHLQHREEQIQKSQNSIQAVQKPPNSNAEPPCSEGQPLMSRSLSLTQALNNNQTRNIAAEALFKRSLKKSVCQSGYSSSDDDGGRNNKGRRKACKHSQQQRSYHLSQRMGRYNDKRSHSRSVPGIEPREGNPDFQILDPDISEEVHTQPASVLPLPSSSKPRESRSSLGQVGANDSDVGVDSPLPLSERLKLRLQST